MPYRLRQSAPRVCRQLLPLLLMSWLSVFCGNCVAMADLTAEAAHHMPMQHAGHDGHPAHDCCDHPAPCLGTDCDHLKHRPALKAESKSEPLSSVVLVALLPEQPVVWPLRTVHTVPQRDTERIATPVQPLYLQHCVFLI